MSIRVVERAIVAEDGTGQVGVRTELFGRNVNVKWFCGDTRTFTPDDVDHFVRCLDALEEFPDVWLEGVDVFDGRFVARIVDGELQAQRALHAKRVMELPWRTGRHNERTLYAVVGEEPTRDDVMIGSMDPGLAPHVVALHNEAIGFPWTL